jgi:folate-dependent phosphoribosylglycinamide formyltransferase PurN
MTEPTPLDRRAIAGPIIVLTAGGGNAWMIVNDLASHFPGVEVLQENPESKRLILARRRRRFGTLNAMGQLGTMVVSRFGKRFAAARLEEIAETHGLSMEPDPAIPVRRVASLNDPEAQAFLTARAPAVVVTVSCRILSRETLAAIPCPVINLHAGINPAYRGQMGGYWALVGGDAKNFGATVHMVDAGVDTGQTLYEVRGRPAGGDSMLTYPALLTAMAAKFVRQAVADALTGKLEPKPAENGPSRLHFNVPLWTWLYHGLTRGIW